MDLQNTKCVMVLDETLPLGMMANTAAILGATVGKCFPEAIGSDVLDQEGNSHAGIIAIPIPTLKGNPGLLRKLREKLYRPEFANLTVVDFSDIAQSCNTYSAFIEKMAAASESSLRYFGMAIFGEKKQVNQLTGSMPLLR